MCEGAPRKVPASQQAKRTLDSDKPRAVGETAPRYFLVGTFLRSWRTLSSAANCFRIRKIGLVLEVSPFRYSPRWRGNIDSAWRTLWYVAFEAAQLNGGGQAAILRRQHFKEKVMASSQKFALPARQEQLHKIYHIHKCARQCWPNLL